MQNATLLMFMSLQSRNNWNMTDFLTIPCWAWYAHAQSMFSMGLLYDLFRNRIIKDTDIKINWQMVARVACTKFLGVLIDEKLSWPNHIKSIKMKISKGTGILNKAKNIYKLLH